MANYNIQVDLMKIAGTRIENGRVCIPFREGGPVQVQGDACFLKLTAFEIPAKDGMSHLVKPSLSAEQKSGISESDLRAVQYIGRMRPWLKPQTAIRPSRNPKACEYAMAARYASGGLFTRCTHPKADASGTRDCSRIECPKVEV